MLVHLCTDSINAKDGLIFKQIRLLFRKKIIAKPKYLFSSCLTELYSNGYYFCRAAILFRYVY